MLTSQVAIAKAPEGERGQTTAGYKAIIHIRTHMHTTQSVLLSLTSLATSHFVSPSLPSSTCCYGAFWPCGQQTQSLSYTVSAGWEWVGGWGTARSQPQEAVEITSMNSQMHCRCTHTHVHEHTEYQLITLTPPCPTPAPPTVMYVP